MPFKNSEVCEKVPIFAVRVPAFWFYTHTMVSVHMYLSHPMIIVAEITI